MRTRGRRNGRHISVRIEAVAARTWQAVDQWELVGDFASHSRHGGWGKDGRRQELSRGGGAGLPCGQGSRPSSQRD